MRLIMPFLTATLLLIGCGGEQGDEEQIEENLAAIEEAVEEKSFSAIQKYLHSSFVANERMGVDEVRQLLRFCSLRHESLNVAIVGSSTTMHAQLSGRAHSVVSVIVTGSSGFLPSDGSIRRVEVEWIEDSGTWLIRKATWQR